MARVNLALGFMYIVWVRLFFDVMRCGVKEKDGERYLFGLKLIFNTNFSYVSEYKFNFAMLS